MKKTCAFVYLSILFYALPVTADALTPPAPGGREIFVASDAWAWLEPDRAQISVIVEERGDDAAKTSAGVEKKAASVVEAVKSVAGATLQVRSREVSISLAQKNSASSGSGAVARKIVGMETADLSKVGQILDTAIKSGAVQVSEVRYLVRDGTQEKTRAVEEATVKAKQKADGVAKSLGVKLGDLIEAVVTEEPGEKTERLQRQQGENPEQTADEDIHVFVSLRYAIAPL